MTNDDSRRQRLRVAAGIVRHMPPHHPASDFSDFNRAAKEFARWQRLLELAEARGWKGASASARLNLENACRVCRRHFEDVYQELARRSPPPVPKLADMYGELLALEQEFPEVEWDLQLHELRVTTEPITLAGVELGPFQILFQWSRLAQGGRPYRIVALEPNRASSNDSVTHPHVSDERLCEGDARPAIGACLEEGRLYDFFLLVATVLRTYGEGSAYIELSNWHGRPCCDCGGVANEDERTSCERCESDLCGECGHCCTTCGVTSCSSCSDVCGACREYACEGCLRSCAACSRRCCDGCLDEDDHCPRCEKSHEENDSDAAEDPVEAEAA